MGHGPCICAPMNYSISFRYSNRDSIDSCIGCVSISKIMINNCVCCCIPWTRMAAQGIQHISSRIRPQREKVLRTIAARIQSTAVRGRATWVIDDALQSSFIKNKTKLLLY